MYLPDLILGHWQIAVFGVLSLAAIVWNVRNRLAWDHAWNASPHKAISIPERCWTYDAHDIKVFARAAREVHIADQTALQFFLRNILKGSDIFFAIALAAVTAFICYELAVSPPIYTWINWAALPLGAMAVLYGVADVAEDIKLASILRHPHKIDRADAAATNMLTRLKMVSLFLSVVGLAIFLLIAAVQALAGKLHNKPDISLPKQSA
jgi:hypothetical protein